MILFKDFFIKEKDIKNHIIRGVKQKSGKNLGFYKVKNHRKMFFYVPKREKDRQRAKQKAISTLRYPLWHKNYITDYPEITKEFNFYRNRIDKLSAKSKLISVAKFEQKTKLMYKCVRERNIYTLGWRHYECIRLRNLFISEFDFLIEDPDSKRSKGPHGRYCRIPKSLKKYVTDRDEKICQHCGIASDDYQIDHILPIAYGGPPHLWNLQVLCKRCNQRKLSSISFKDGLKALTNLGFSFPELIHDYLE